MIVRDPILHLKDIDLLVMQLRDEENLTFKEIGERIGKSSSRAGDIYKHAKRIKEELDKIDTLNNDVEFHTVAAANLPLSVYNALRRRHKLDSKETLLSMTDEEIMNLRNVGFKGRLALEKFMKSLGRDVESEKFPFKDEDIDPEMLEIVKNFNRAEVETDFCCQGHFKDSDQGMSIPYLSFKLPKSNRVLLALMRSQVKYPMLNIIFGFALPYTPNLEESCEVDEYISRVDNALDNCEAGHISIRPNYVLYNLAEDIYNNEENYEKVFEHLRQRFISDLTKLSEDILRIYRSNK